MSETEIRMVTRSICETQIFYVRVAKGTPDDKVAEACLEGDALYGTPHNTDTKQNDTNVGDVVDEAYAAKFGEPIDLVEETTHA